MEIKGMLSNLDAFRFEHKLQWNNVARWIFRHCEVTL